MNGRHLPAHPCGLVKHCELQSPLARLISPALVRHNAGSCDQNQQTE
jgi:hypothetical protein